MTTASALLLLLMSASPLPAQWAPDRGLTLKEVPPEEMLRLHQRQLPASVTAQEPRPMWPSILGGLGGAVVGFVGGATVAYHIDRASPCACEDPGLSGLLAGAAFGPAILVPVGAHMASGTWAALPMTLSTGTLIGALSLVLAPPMNGLSLLLGPVATISTTVAIERLTDPR